MAFIYMVKTELGLSDSEYRNILKKIAGVMSARYLKAKTFKMLINEFIWSRRYYIELGELTVKQKLFIR